MVYNPSLENNKDQVESKSQDEIYSERPIRSFNKIERQQRLEELKIRKKQREIERKEKDKEEEEEKKLKVHEERERNLIEQIERENKHKEQLDRERKQQEQKDRERKQKEREERERKKIEQEKEERKHKELIQTVEEISVQLLDRMEIYSLIRNYIRKTDSRALLEPNFIMELEVALLDRFPRGLEMFNVSNDEIEHLSNPDGYQPHIDKNEIHLYLKNSFLKLTKLVERRLHRSSEEELVFITWSLLRRVAIEHYFDLFNEDYGSNFKNFETNSLADFVQRYTHIDILDPYSLYNSNLFTYYLMKKNKFADSQNYNKCNKVVLRQLTKALEIKDLDDFEKQLLQENLTQNILIDDIDLMTGYEFEEFVAKLFRKMGYKADVTRASGDQGIDVIVQKNGRGTGIQTKCYSKVVSNTAIQEVVAGINFYDLDKGLVITNNYFTYSAVELAEKNNIILWDRNKLVEKLTLFFR